MRKVLLTLSVLLLFVAYGSSQTTLAGKVSNPESGELLPFATITISKNDVFITGTDTDFDGNYSLSGLEPGTYDVEASYVGYTAQKQVGVVVKAGKTNRLDFKLSEGVVIDIEIIAYKVPLIEQDNTTSGKTVTAETIRSLPTRSVAGIAATSAGLSTNEGGAISIRGSRTDATYYYIDGIRVSSASMIPTSEIEQMQVITGGIEAQYGDVTGGIISVTSKGPSQKFTGGVELESSQFLDAFGSNLVSANFSGPLLKNDKGESVLGFRLAGQFRRQEDDFPSALGVYRLSEEKIAELEATPVTIQNGSPFASGELLVDSDIDGTMDARPNEDRTDLNLTAKFDARISSNMDISLSGSMDDVKNRFTPSSAWSLANWTNNPYSYNNGYRGNFRFRHKLGYQGFGSDLTEEEKASRNTSIRNANYTIQFGYEKRFSRTEDYRHEDNLFRYGYFGRTEREWTADASIVSDTAIWGGQEVFDQFGRAWAHQGYTQQNEGFVANEEINPVLGRYNTINGTLDGTVSGMWGLYSNVGQVYNNFQKSETDIYSINVTSGFEFLPGGSESGRHNLQFGFLYEQRISRAFSAAPQSLWTLARLQANSHIIGVDTLNSINTILQTIPGFEDAKFDQYQTLVDEGSIFGFNKRIRELTNKTKYDYINVDGLNPDDLHLGLFDASELTDQGLVGYYGYDYTGEKIGNGAKFNDFFTREEDGTRKFTVAPLTPIYGAVYLQDKFTYKDIIFRLGLRVDYYDANTKVMIDPYSLYDIETASDFAARTGQAIPSSVGDDYKVYVAGEESDDILGYRKGDQWFLKNGTEVSDGNVLFNGGLVYPSIKKQQGGDVPDIQSDEFDPSFAFDDYDPQLSFMPRLAFSFPISEDANFFAHYDILAQRPPSGTAATALNYYYFEDPGRTPLNNPNLRPEKTIDYEVGFQQKLTNSSALKVSLYYKEMRDMIQRRFYLNVPAPVNNYESTANLDFGTVKGFTLGYDRRRTGNIELGATYTLQFADGTGSDINASRGINSRGNIRTLLPLSFDERHRLTGTIDYRYSSGKQYNGPRIGGRDIFANAGANFVLNAVSGRPYTRLQNAAVLGGSGYVGSINGARLPWQFDVDMRVDKRFKIKVSEGGRPIYANVYIRVENLLNTRNVIGVYPVSGDPDDDGYLVSSFGQDQIRQTEDIGKSVEAFLSSYQWRVLNPGFYTIPRRIYLGAIFDF